MENNNIALMSHPPNSPDLNPIELVWAILKKRVEEKNPKTAQ